MTQSAPPGYGWFSYALRSVLARATPDEQAWLQDVFRHYCAEFEQHRTHDPKSLAHTLHSLVDEEVSHHQAQFPDQTRTITCRKGCAACCHILLDATTAEALLALAAADEAGLTIDRGRLARQQGHTIDTWRELPMVDQTCVFLQPDQTCGIYEHRPAACRKYFVVSDPARCDTVLFPGGGVMVWNAPLAEVMMSAFGTVYGMARWPDLLQSSIDASSRS